VLLPRSTGLHYSLRSLAPRIPSLRLIDVTIIYPGNLSDSNREHTDNHIMRDAGIPPRGYGQSYYTLRSIFFDRVPPPFIRMHLRIFDVAKDIPIGDTSAMASSTLPKANAQGKVIETDFPESEKAQFDAWLQKLWAEKDKFITAFHQSGTLPSHTKALEMPVEVRHKREIPDVFCFGLGPALAYLLWTKLMQS